MTRQKRYYSLRTVYLLLLIALMTFVWFQVMPSVRLNQNMTARMAQAGKSIVVFIAWFQFIGLQLVTVLIMSNAISDEIYRRTLPALMTTPITSRQIVLGKLGSKGLQIFLLFCLSIPLLAMVRVFGGVPWQYLVSTFCMTVTTVWFLSVLTLLYSIFFKRSYTAIVFTVMTTAILFGLIPFIMFFIMETARWPHHSPWLRMVFSRTLIHICPYVSFWIETKAMMSPTARTSFVFWPLHCAFIILWSVPLLILACVFVRRAALRHMVAKKNHKEYKVPPSLGKREILYRPLFLHNWIRRAIGTGMIWKEFLMPVLGRFRFVVYGAAGLFTALFALSLIIAILFERIELVGFLFMLSVTSFFILAVLFTVIVPASCIASEKESQCWPILLTTTMSNSRILGGKLAGVLRRIVLAWSPFLFIFALLAYTMEMSIPTAMQLTVVSVISIGFIIALGLYISTRRRRTAPAVLMNMAIVGILWGLLPFISTALWSMRYQWHWIKQSSVCRSAINITLHMTPSGLITTLLEHTRRGQSLWYYDSPRDLGYGLIYITIYISATALLLWRAQANIRRHQI
ncbi:ABC transporter permease [Planctomycetota bacterium]